jgi:hypothetical protein
MNARFKTRHLRLGKWPRRNLQRKLEPLVSALQLLKGLFGLDCKQTDARFRQTDRRFGLVQLDIRNLRKEMNARFAVMEEQMKRIEERLEHVEAARL